MSGSHGIGGPGWYFGVPLVAGARTQTALDVGANSDAAAANTETVAATAVDDDNEENGVDSDDDIEDDADVDTNNNEYWPPAAMKWFQEGKDEIDSSVKLVGRGHTAKFSGAMPKKYCQMSDRQMIFLVCFCRRRPLLFQTFMCIFQKLATHGIFPTRDLIANGTGTQIVLKSMDGLRAHATVMRSIGTMLF